MSASALLVASPPASRLQSLQLEHDDLDAAIAALFQGSGTDDLILSRLKKRKLHLKDEIAALLTALAPLAVARAS